MRADGPSATDHLYGGATTYPPSDSFFDSLNGLEAFGYSPAFPPGMMQHDIPGLARSTGPGGAQAEAAPPWSPENPLFWLGVLLGVTTGLVAFSTHFGVRVGKGRARANLDLGQGA